MEIEAVEEQQPDTLRLRQAIEAGDLGVWDLRPELETVQYSPQWKQRLGFPEPQAPDSTHFWRCRVHPDDLEQMLGAMRAHLQGTRPRYEAQFRLRSNGSGYRLVRSRGRVIERSAPGRALRMVGTMIDLTDRPGGARHGLPQGPRGPMQGRLIERPFHLLLTIDERLTGADESASAALASERDSVLPLVDDLLQETLAQLKRTGAARQPDWQN